MSKKYNPLLKAGLDIFAFGGTEAAELFGKMNKNGDNYTEDEPLVSPVMSGVWTILKNDGETQSATSAAAIITLEYGAKVHLTSTFRWTAAAGYKNPTAIAGVFGTLLPNSDVELTYNTPELLTESTTFNVMLSANKGGLIVVNSKVKRATGSDTTSANMSVTFKHRLYSGVTESETITDEIVRNSDNSVLGTTRIQTKTFNCTGGRYFYFAIPTVLCTGIGFVIGGLSNSNFQVETREITNEYGLAINYNIYRIGDIQNGSSITVNVN